MKAKKFKDTDYLSLSAVLRAKEARLLGRDRLDRMLSEPDFAGACRAAADAGYADMSGLDVAGINAALEQRRCEELADLRAQIKDPRLTELLCLQYDCHNAKTLVKAEGDPDKGAGLFSAAGCYTPEQLKAVYDDPEEGDGDLPAGFAEAIRSAKVALARTGNPQIADFLLDKAYFSELLSRAKAAKRPFLVNYVRGRIDKVNLRSLLRTLDMGKRGDLLANALIEGGTVPLDAVSDPALGREEIQKLYAGTVFARAAEAEGMTAFEKTADNAENEFLAGSGMIPFGPEVALEYVSALENEIVSLRIILTGKRMGIGAETLRERLRESYV